MSSLCGIRQVESQAHAYYVTQFTYKSEKSTDLNCSISRVSYVHSSRLPMNDYNISFLLQKARSADFEFQLILYSRVETARHLVRLDFFCKNLHKTLNLSLSCSLSLSLSLSLFTYTTCYQSLQTVWIQKIVRRA